MTLREWFLLFVVSIFATGEALLWAITHGQFQNVNRACSFPLRQGYDQRRAGELPVVDRPAVRRYQLGLGMIAAVCCLAIVAALLLTFRLV